MPAQAGIQAVFLAMLAFFLDSRFRGNDDSAFLSVKNLLLKGPPCTTDLTAKACGLARAMNPVLSPHHNALSSLTHGQGFALLYESGIVCVPSESLRRRSVVP